MVDHLIGQLTYELLMSFFKVKVTRIKNKFITNNVETFTSKKSGFFMVKQLSCLPDRIKQNIRANSSFLPTQNHKTQNSPRHLFSLLALHYLFYILKIMAFNFLVCSL